jgi:hypothetical protein
MFSPATTAASRKRELRAAGASARVQTAAPGRDAVEELADRRQVAVLLFGEHHVRGVVEHDQFGVRQPPRHLLRRADRARAVVAPGEHKHRMRHLAEPMFDVDPP